jgi:hypothetical protein
MQVFSERYQECVTHFAFSKAKRDQNPGILNSSKTAFDQSTTTKT